MRMYAVTNVFERLWTRLIILQGTLKFQVKWEGYESKKDLTWEPEENLQYDRRRPLAY